MATAPSTDPFDRNPRRLQELRLRPAADALYARLLGEGVQVKRFEREERYVLDQHFAIDAQLTLPSGMVLLAQEKFLSAKYATFQTVTVEYQQDAKTGEPGDWFRLACQLYFVGYETAQGGTFAPWVLLNWPAVVLSTMGGRIRWLSNANQDGHARATFRFCKMREIPPECIIAASWQEGQHAAPQAVEVHRPTPAPAQTRPALGPQPRPSAASRAV